MLKQAWQGNPHPYFLVDQSTLTQLNLKSVQPLGEAEGWSLITRALSAPSIQASTAFLGSRRSRRSRLFDLHRGRRLKRQVLPQGRLGQNRC